MMDNLPKDQQSPHALHLKLPWKVIVPDEPRDGSHVANEDKTVWMISRLGNRLPVKQYHGNTWPTFKHWHVLHSDRVSTHEDARKATCILLCESQILPSLLGNHFPNVLYDRPFQELCTNTALYF